MAFQNVNQKGTFMSVTKLAVGESLTGYILGFEQSQKFKDKTNIIMQKEGTGERLVISTAGNLTYIVRDNKLAAGANTRITRNADKLVKGKTSTNFTVEQDPEDTIAVSGSQQASQQPSASSMASTLSSLKSLT